MSDLFPQSVVFELNWYRQYYAFISVTCMLLPGCPHHSLGSSLSEISWCHPKLGKFWSLSSSNFEFSLLWCHWLSLVCASYLLFSFLFDHSKYLPSKWFHSTCSVALNVPSRLTEPLLASASPCLGGDMFIQSQAGQMPIYLVHPPSSTHYHFIW